MFVLDASVTMTWCFPDETTALSEALLDRLRDEGARVPSVWPLEVANTLLLGERQHRLSPADSATFVRLVQTLPIDVDGPSGLELALGAIRAIGKEQGLTSYDASYVELALREGLALATDDGRMRTAAVRLGVALVNVEQPST